MQPLPPAYAGKTFRQLAWKLRFQRGPGKPDVASVRPRDEQNGRFLDTDEAPTLVTFQGDELGVDVPMLLRAGALQEWTPPRKAQGVKGG